MQQFYLNSITDIENVFRKVLQDELLAFFANHISPKANTSPFEEPLLSKGQLAKELRITNPTLSELLHKNNIKYYKVGKRQKFKLSEVLEGINNKKK